MQRQEILEVFELFDSDGVGAIEAKELGVAMRALGFSDSKDEIAALADRISTSGQTGGRVILLDAFTDAMAERIASRDPTDEIKRAFELFDEGNTGKITLATLRKVAKDLGEVMTDQELEEMIAEADSDNDGQVTLEDFIKLMQATNIYS